MEESLLIIWWIVMVGSTVTGLIALLMVIVYSFSDTEIDKNRKKIALKVLLGALLVFVVGFGICFGLFAL